MTVGDQAELTESSAGASTVAPALFSSRGNGTAAVRLERKAGRLHNQAQFSQVREAGANEAGRLVVVKYLPSPDGQTRCGIVTSRKFSLKAVVRNRARRLLREAWRVVLPKLERPAWVVLIPRHPVKAAKAPVVAEDLQRVLIRAKWLSKVP